MDLSEFTASQMREAIRRQLGPKLPMEYEPRIVVYLDILGFRELLKDTERLQELVSWVSILREAFASSRSRIRNGSVLQVSDGIIIASEVANIGELDSFLREIVRGVEQLMCVGVIIRGAITYGLHYYRDSILVSPAFLRAYDLERNVAKYPRVVIDVDVMERQRELIGPDTEIKDLPLNRYTKLDSDGYRFVHFMKAPLEEGYDLGRSGSTPVLSKETHIEHMLVLLQHRIEEGFENSNTNAIRAKYVWLANYFNESVRNDLFLNRESQSQYRIGCKYLELPDKRNPNL